MFEGGCYEMNFLLWRSGTVGWRFKCWSEDAAR